MRAPVICLLLLAALHGPLLSRCQKNKGLLEKVVAAIEDDDAETVLTILEEGLDPNSRYNDTSTDEGEADSTLLHWAAQFDSPASAEVLIEFEAKVEATDAFGDTPLHVCGYFGSACRAAPALRRSELALGSRSESVVLPWTF